MIDAGPSPEKTRERRKNPELRAVIEFLVDIARRSNKSSWTCISETYDLICRILKESRDLSVSEDLQQEFESNRRIIEQIFHGESAPKRRLSGPLGHFLTKFLHMKETLKGSERSSEESFEDFCSKVEAFLREYVIAPIGDQRVIFLLVMTVIYRELATKSTPKLRTEITLMTKMLDMHEIRSDKAVTILIYNLCQASVDAIATTDYSHATLYCERAVELFKLITGGSRLKEAIRSQIEEAMRITTERLINRIQERDESEQVRVVEDLVEQLVNIDLMSYLLPQLVFFLIRAQKYEDCLNHLERVLNAPDLSGDFMDYQTATTMCFEWCDSLLKAERYSRGQVRFSFIEREKKNIARVYQVASRIVIPQMEDETFFNVEIEKLAVTLSHLGTLYFLTGDLEQAVRAYQQSFAVIALKKCSRNRDSMDEILDRYKDIIHHPLNNAPREAHGLIATLASEKGYDILMEAHLKKLAEDAIPFNKDEQNFTTLIHPQKELIADLMDSVENKLKFAFAAPYVSYKPLIEQKFNAVKEKMQFVASASY